jgi:hypothetical protein
MTISVIKIPGGGGDDDDDDRDGHRNVGFRHLTQLTAREDFIEFMALTVILFAL